MEIVVHEDEVKSCARNRSLVHGGVTSCLTVTAVLDDELVGLHVVQFGADNTTYAQRLPGLLARFNQRINGRTIRHLFLVAPIAFYPEGIEDDIEEGVQNAPDLELVDITGSSEVGNDVYFIGYANTVQVVARGKVVHREQW